MDVLNDAMGMSSSKFGRSEALQDEKPVSSTNESQEENTEGKHDSL